jgi:hypothetical protein
MAQEANKKTFCPSLQRLMLFVISVSNFSLEFMINQALQPTLINPFNRGGFKRWRSSLRPLSSAYDM